VPVACRLHCAEANRAARSHRRLRRTSGIGLKNLCDRFRTENDDYNAIMAEAIADRLAEAFRRMPAQARARRVGYGPRGGPEHRRHHPMRSIAASGLPRVTRHARTTRKGHALALLDVEANTGMLITESFAMWPGSSVSGLYFAHRNRVISRWAKIDRDQVADYAERQGHERGRGRTVAGAKPELLGPVHTTRTVAPALRSSAPATKTCPGAHRAVLRRKQSGQYFHSRPRRWGPRHSSPRRRLGSPGRIFVRNAICPVV